MSKDTNFSPQIQSKIRSRKAVSPVAAAVIIAAIFIVGIVLAAAGGYITIPSQHTQTLTSPNGQSLVTTAQTNQQCAPSTPQPITVLASHYSSDASLSNLQWNRFYQSGSNLVQVSDNPGSLTDGTKSSASSNLYAIGPSANGLATQGPTWEQVTQSASPNAYPMWVGPTSASILTNPVQNFGQTVFQVSCAPSSSNSAASTWAASAVLFEAPSSGTSATTNVETTITYAGGAAAPTAWPTAATTWNVQVVDFSNYKVVGLNYPECGTQANPVTNYATGSTFYGCPSGPGQAGLPTVGMVGIIASNVTAISVSVGPGFTLTPISGIPTGTRAWVVTSSGLGYLTPSGPAPSTGVSSTNPYVAFNIPITVYETQSQGSSKGTICFGAADFQQSGYLASNFNIPAQTTYTSGHWCKTATGSIAGLPTNFTSLTPTASINSGNPAALVDQWYTLDALTY